MWKRWSDLSLSIRLTLVYVGLVAALLVADGAILYVETREFLIDSTAIRMRDTATPRVADWLDDHREAADTDFDLVGHAGELSTALTSPDTTAAVLDIDGRVISDGGALAGLESVAVDGERLGQALRGQDVTYLDEVGSVANLVALLPLRLNGDTVVGVVQLSSPLTSTEAILGRELLGIVVVVLITVLLAGLGGYVLTTRSLLPLRRVIDTCRQIAAGDLTRRVALPPRGDEVGQVGTAFNEMATRIEAAFEVQSRFIRDAAHELRTPLTALQGAMEVLLRGSHDDPAATRQLMRAMHHDMTRLTALAEQLLDTAHLGTPIPLHRVEVDLSAFLDEQLRNARLLNPRHEMVGAFATAPSTISVDSNLLGQALLNLLDNAAQHSPEGSTIRLESRIDGDLVRISVVDQGEGIGPEDLPNVFQSFYRSDRSRSRQRGGAGLGLALVDAIVAAHGGTVSAESALGVGSTFTMVLPRHAPASAGTAWPTPVPRAGGPVPVSPIGTSRRDEAGEPPPVRAAS